MTRDRDHRSQPAVSDEQDDRAGGESTGSQTVDVLAELVDEAVFGLDDDGQLTGVNSRFAILVGLRADDLVGCPLSAFVDGDAERLSAVVRALSQQPPGEQTTLGVDLRTDSGQGIACQLSLAVAGGAVVETGARSDQPTLVGTARPVDTAEAELRRRASQQAAVAALGQRAVDSDCLDALMADAARLVRDTLDTTHCKVLDLDADVEALRLRQGVGWDAGVVGSATIDATANSQAGYTLLSEEPVIVEDLDTETRFRGPELLTSHGVTSGVSVTIGSSDEPWGILGVHDRRRRTFTDDDANFVQSMANVLASAIDSHRRRAELERYAQIIETVNDGVYVVDREGRFTMVNAAYCELTGYSRAELLGAHTSLLVDDAVRDRAVALEAEMAADGIESPTMEATLTTADGSRIEVEATFALLADDDSFERVAVVRDISERKAYERQLETERTKLAALDEVNTVVREITDAILDQSTRHEIEQLVCESLAAFDSYRFAWIGEVNSRTNEIEPHAEAGTAGYLDEVTVSTDPADRLSRGPAGRAVETQRLQVSQNVFEDPSFEPWRAVASEWEYQSVAAIPISHDGTLYGVLGLYSHEADAFATEKQAIIEQLGEIVGHAIAAVERKQALMSDLVTEIEIEISDVFAGTEGVDGEITLDHVVPAGGETYLQYGRTAPDQIPVLKTLTTEIDAWESVTVLSESETVSRFELQLSEPPITSMIAQKGGSITEAVITDADLRLTVQMPPSTNVRGLVSWIQQIYPDTRPIARRQVTRSELSTDRLGAIWGDLLTDKQRASLEAAYFAGFFEWPRDSSGQELAAKMDVAPATFHQHLRAAERKLFAAVIGEADTELKAVQ